MTLWRSFFWISYDIFWISYDKSYDILLVHIMVIYFLYNLMSFLRYRSEIFRDYCLDTIPWNNSNLWISLFWILVHLFRLRFRYMDILTIILDEYRTLDLIRYHFWIFNIVSDIDD